MAGAGRVLPEPQPLGAVAGAGRGRANNGGRAGRSHYLRPGLGLRTMPRKRQVTWVQPGIRNAGMRATTRGLKFALGWGLATVELGREPESIEEYAETMEESRATAFRDQQAFRKAFPTKKRQPA